MSRCAKAAFTLVEILVAAALVGVIGAAVMGFYIQSLKHGNATEQQMDLLATMRSFTNELVFHGSRSHELILYNSAAPADRTAANRKVVVNDDTESEDDDICPTGDFAVFVFYELPKPADQSQYRIAKLIGYYLESYDAGPPRLVRIIIDQSAAPSTSSVETLLDTYWNSAPRTTIAARVSPLALSDDYATGTPPQLFYRRANQNLAVCGQLLQSTARIDTHDRRTYTRTFYFTVTVRS